jgi:predicted RNase H-like HicB family nuclease
MVMKYAVVIEKLPGNYCAHVPDLQVCVFTGATLEEVRHNIREAVAAYLEVARENGTAVPLPSTHVEVIDVA